MSGVSLGQRVALLMTVILVLVAAFATITTFEERARLRDAKHLTRVLVPAAMASDDLLAAMVDQETGERGFVITGQASFLEPYRAGQARAPVDLITLRRLLRSDPVSVKELAGVQQAITAWQQGAAVPEIDAVTAGDLAGAAADVSTGRGKALFDTLRARISALSNRLDVQERAANDALNRDSGIVADLLIAGLAIAVAVVAAVAVFVRRWILAPIRAVSEDMRMVVSGSHEHPILATGPPEISALARDADAMRRRILSDLEGARRSAEALRQHAPAVAALRQYLVPSDIPTVTGLDVAGRIVAAEGLLTGDWYDVIALSDRRWRIDVVDVSGHGPDAGVLALRTKTFLEAASEVDLDLGGKLAWLARRLGDTGDRFLTALVMEIDLDAGTLTYANGGHPPILLLPPEAETVELQGTGPLVGPLAGRWSTVTCPFAPGAMLVAYTDGLTEARNNRGEQFGVARLVGIIERARGRCAAEVADAIITRLDDFARLEPQDDITLVVIRRPARSA